MQQTLWGRLMAGLRAFREAFLSSEPLDTDDFDDFDARRLRYALLWSFYENSAYRSIHTWATAYKAQYSLYRYIRQLYNPAYRLATFWQTHLWGGPLDPAAGDGEIIPTALPIDCTAATADALRAAISRIWSWSNWPIRKDVVSLWGTVLGDVAIRVVDDTDRRKVYLDLVHPGTLAEVTLDAYNNVKGYTIQETRPHPDGAHGTVTYAETAERGAGEDVVFRTYLDGQPWAWNQQAAEWVEPYGFIPLVVIRHNDVGLDWGWSEIHPARSKIHEVDDLASILSDQIRRHLNTVWLFAGDKPRSTPTVTGATPTAYIPDPGREEIPVLYTKDPAVKPYPLVADLDIAGSIQHMMELLKELERDYPELRFDNLRVSGEVSGATLRVARQPVETKVNMRRAGYDDALVRAHNMAVAIAGWRGLPGFQPFNLGSFAQGDLEHSIALRPVFEVDPMDRLDEDKAFWTNAQAAVDAGLPLKLFLRREGWTEQELAEIPDVCGVPDGSAGPDVRGVPDGSAGTDHLPGSSEPGGREGEAP